MAKKKKEKKGMLGLESKNNNKKEHETWIMIDLKHNLS